MPLSSVEISQMAGGYQALAMNQMSHAGMIGTQFPGYGGQPQAPQGEQMMGTAMNKLAGVGAPMAAGGMMLAGADPFSLGAKAGWGARGGGLIGMGAAGLAAAAPMAVGLMGAQYMGNQMFQGAQQQQQLSSMMRQNYGYMGMAGGQGFTGTSMGSMGQMMRNMTTEMGPMGQQTNMDELTRLASNMGRMGMTQGVRNAKEFSDRFKEMVSSLKEVAETLGTSLEEAQKMMAGAKSAGVFGQKSQVAAIKAASQLATSSGVAVSEMTGMQVVGSQISRMTGGRGRHGAIAGMQSLATIGTAGQMGILSEEDIYDVTGQRGAEGRRAFSSNMLQQSARFLRGKLGRRVVAAMAGKDGELNEESVEEFMAGGVGTGRTMQMAHGNLAKVGRADFIRNEGRLRGQVMARFGGLMPAVAMRGWLQQRGMDMESDRAMIFAQRRLGMGRDEAEQMMKLVRNLPQIMQERKMRGVEAEDERDLMHRIEAQRAGTGVEGLKRRFTEARAEVQKTLQQVGADFFESGSAMLDRFVNRISDRYVERYQKDALRIYRDATSGSAQGGVTFDRYFGGGVGGPGLAQRMGLEGAGAAGSITHFDRRRFKEAGYELTATTDSGMEAQLRRRSEIREAFLTQGKGTKAASSWKKLGQAARAELNTAFSSGEVRGRGAEAMSSLLPALERAANKSGDHSLKEMVKELRRSGGSAQGAGMLSNILQGANMEDAVERFIPPELQGGIAGQWRTHEERQEALGSLFYGEKGVRSEIEKLETGLATRGLFERDEEGGLDYQRMANLAASGPLAVQAVGAELLGKALGKPAAEMTMRSKSRRQRAMGEYMESGAGRDMIAGMLRGSTAERSAMVGDLYKRTRALQGRTDRTSAETAELDAKQAALMHYEYSQATTPEQRKKVMEDWEHVTGGDAGFMQRMTALGVADDENKRALIRQSARAAGAQARSVKQEMIRTGVISEDGGVLTLSSDVRGKLEGIAPEAADFVSQMVGATLAEANMQGTGGAEEADLGRIEEARMLRAGARGVTLTDEQKRSIIDKTAGYAGLGGVRGQLRRQVAISDVIKKGRQRGGRAVVGGEVVGGLGGVRSALGVLGVGMKKEDLKKMYETAEASLEKGEVGPQEAGAGGDAAAAERVLENLGATGEEAERLRGQLTEAMRTARTGKGDIGKVMQGLESSDDWRSLKERSRLETAKQEDPIAAKQLTMLTGIQKATMATAKALGAPLNVVDLNKKSGETKEE